MYKYAVYVHVPLIFMMFTIDPTLLYALYTHVSTNNLLSNCVESIYMYTVYVNEW